MIKRVSTYYLGFLSVHLPALRGLVQTITEGVIQAGSSQAVEARKLILDAVGLKVNSSLEF